MASRARRLGLRIGVALFAATLPVAGAELWLRVRGTYLLDRDGQPISAEAIVQFGPRGKRLRPGVSVTCKNHPISGRTVELRTNALGFRHRELDEPKKAPRVIVFGDSITLADYVPLDEAWTSRAAEKLPGVEVVNAGVGDTGTDEQLANLEDTVAAAKPDAIVLAWYLNDSRPSWGFPGELGSPGWLRRHSVLAETLYRDLALSRWMEDQGQNRFAWYAEARRDRALWTKDPAAFRAFARVARYDWGAAWEDDSWPPIERGFDRLLALSKARAFKVGVVVMPVAYQVETEFLDDAPQKKVAELCAKRGFAFLDALPLERSSKFEFYDHCHPKPRENALLGEAVARWIVDSKLSDR